MMKAELYWIEGPWPGRLAILPRPRGGDWLEDEVRAWQHEGIDLVVSLLEKEEMVELDIVGEPEICKAQGIEYLWFPIADRGVPSSPPPMAELVHRLEARLTGGTKIAVHCRAGIGRSALLAACLLMSFGADLDSAFERIRRARGCPVPDTEEQRNWVARFASDYLATLPGE